MSMVMAIQFFGLNNIYGIHFLRLRDPFATSKNGYEKSEPCLTLKTDPI